MELKKLHSWQISVNEALELQRRLAKQVCGGDGVIKPRYIAGVDVSASRGQEIATGAVVVLEYPGLDIVEVKVVEGKSGFDYRPGLLSFRELPVILAACEELSNKPDLVLVDGQGIAHPRRFGLACHLGLFLDTPTIGCAKSRLCGKHEMPGVERGDYAELMVGEETIGVVLRTRQDTKPLYISVGHKIDLPAAISLVLECCRGYRLPEPTRLAHQAAGGNLKPGEKIVTPEISVSGRAFR